MSLSAMSLSSMKRTTNMVGLLCPHVQNGVGENRFYPCSVSSAGATGARPARMASPKRQMEDELDNLDSWSGPRLRFDRSRFAQSGNEDGSLPSSPPDSPSDCAEMAAAFPGTQQHHHGLERETRELLRLFFRVHVGLGRAAARGKSKALATLTRVVDDVIGKHQIAYNGMVQKLCLEQKEDDMGFVTVVAKKLFDDGTTNWGRVASLVAFGAMVCRRLKDSGREHCMEAVGDQISTYLLTEQREWLLSNKGWDGFVDFFHVEDAESVVRNALMAFAGVAGIGAGLAFLIR
ncbi:hypothetical protein AAFF_G00221260 [Aldrovandia affinis]|uniref:Bcl-2 Bcl-2 homology region 1-3 domain-containing protein n=1 Tax=Aldrovandia affinis TaxID=143900 RepID=A0AAD7W411_9TELE|nr:hypothetical protein AAFF_G00221260 [Aldrovandia affinis]